MVPMTGNKLSASPEAMRARARRSTRRWASRPRTSRSGSTSRARTRTRSRCGASRRRRRRAKAGKFDDEIVPVHGHRYDGGKRVERRVQARRAGARGHDARGPRGAQAGVLEGRERSRRATRSPLSDGAAAALVHEQGEGRRARREAARLLPRVRDGGRRPGDHGHRPDPGGAQAPREDGAHDEGHRPLRAERGLREPGGLRAATLEIPDEKLNVNGGAIALGHPLGCTGAKLTATALHELQRRNGRYAIVTMCIGGGMGAAGLFERA